MVGIYLPLKLTKPRSRGEHVSKIDCGMLAKGVGGRYSLPTGGGSKQASLISPP